jgi:hypothetical protein
MKIGCLFINISDDYYVNNNYLKDNDEFFIPNAINSFKKWHPEIEVHYVNNDNLQEYCKKLGLEEIYNHISLIRLSLVIGLMKYYQYDKIFFLGIDTITCSRLEEFLNDNESDAIYTLGPPQYVETEYWKSPIIEFKEENGIYRDVAFINGDVACYNNVDTIELVRNLTIEKWHGHVDQGTMNYLYINQNEYNKKVKIVDFPYYKSPVVYNVRSKGVVGGYCLVRGNVLSGRNGSIISTRYPMLDFYIDNNQLYTKDHKQIRVFHYCEGLSIRTNNDEMSYEESVNEIKTMWFNPDTISFFKEQCNCIFP